MDRITSQLKSLVLWSTYVLYSDIIPYEHTHTCTPSSPTPFLIALYSDPLHRIMRELMENIMKAPAGMQHVRAYLYGSLLYYLLLTKQEGGEGKKEGVWMVP